MFFCMRFPPFFFLIFLCFVRIFFLRDFLLFFKNQLDKTPRNDRIGKNEGGVFMDQDILKVLVTQEQLQQRIKELGNQITNDYQGKRVVMVCILRGAVLFYGELAKEVKVPLSMDFMAVSSYHGGVKSSGIVRIIHDLEENIKDMDVLIIEDIVDSGLTLNYLVENLKSRQPNSIKVCSLLDKPYQRITPVKADYVGFEIPDEFVVGYGLDYKELYRNLPYIGVLKPEVYTD
jgi:hypoxanthine phosphoribosyltransferase